MAESDKQAPDLEDLDRDAVERVLESFFKMPDRLSAESSTDSMDVSPGQSLESLQQQQQVQQEALKQSEQQLQERRRMRQQGQARSLTQHKQQQQQQQQQERKRTDKRTTSLEGKTTPPSEDVTRAAARWIDKCLRRLVRKIKDHGREVTSGQGMAVIEYGTLAKVAASGFESLDGLIRTAVDRGIVTAHPPLTQRDLLGDTQLTLLRTSFEDADTTTYTPQHLRQSTRRRRHRRRIIVEQQQQQQQQQQQGDDSGGREDGAGGAHGGGSGAGGGGGGRQGGDAPEEDVRSYSVSNQRPQQSRAAIHDGRYGARAESVYLTNKAADALMQESFGTVQDMDKVKEKLRNLSARESAVLQEEPLATAGEEYRSTPPGDDAPNARGRTQALTPSRQRTRGVRPKQRPSSGDSTGGAIGDAASHRNNTLQPQSGRWPSSSHASSLSSTAPRWAHRSQTISRVHRQREQRGLISTLADLTLRDVIEVEPEALSTYSTLVWGTGSKRSFYAALGSSSSSSSSASSSGAPSMRQRSSTTSTAGTYNAETIKSQPGTSFTKLSATASTLIRRHPDVDITARPELDVDWMAFSEPELRNFLRILDAEELLHRKQVEAIYTAKRARLQQKLDALRNPEPDAEEEDAGAFGDYDDGTVIFKTETTRAAQPSRTDTSEFVNESGTMVARRRPNASSAASREERQIRSRSRVITTSDHKETALRSKILRSPSRRTHRDRKAVDEMLSVLIDVDEAQALAALGQSTSRAMSAEKKATPPATTAARTAASAATEEPNRRSFLIDDLLARPITTASKTEQAASRWLDTQLRALVDLLAGNGHEAAQAGKPPPATPYQRLSAAAGEQGVIENLSGLLATAREQGIVAYADDSGGSELTLPRDADVAITLLKPSLASTTGASSSSASSSSSPSPSSASWTKGTRVSPAKPQYTLRHLQRSVRQKKRHIVKTASKKCYSEV